MENRARIYWKWQLMMAGKWPCGGLSRGLGTVELLVSRSYLVYFGGSHMVWEWAAHRSTWSGSTVFFFFLAFYKAWDGVSLWFRHWFYPTGYYILAVYGCANAWKIQQVSEKTSWSQFTCEPGWVANLGTHGTQTCLWLSSQSCKLINCVTSQGQAWVFWKNPDSLPMLAITKSPIC